MSNNKALVEKGITAEIYKRTNKIFQKIITAKFYGCLKIGTFTERWEKAQNFTNYETGYKNARESHQKSPNNPSKCGKEYTGKGID